MYVECDIVFDPEGGQRLYGVGLFPAEVELRGLVLFDYVLPIQSKVIYANQVPVIK